MSTLLLLLLSPYVPIIQTASMLVFLDPVIEQTNQFPPRQKPGVDLEVIC